MIKSTFQFVWSESEAKAQRPGSSQTFQGRQTPKKGLSGILPPVEMLDAFARISFIASSSSVFARNVIWNITSSRAGPQLQELLLQVAIVTTRWLHSK